ncbi:ABC transporter ATP-binding protein [Patescibacteria group bacterium]|nr:ABC transporter ATP-binding protein [Patescibacteria group bacterium]
MISVNEVKKIYSVGGQEIAALDGVSFTIQKGEFVAIMGPSGSGKSTLMHLLGALDTPSSGTYTLDNQDVSAMSDDQLAEIRNHKIGFIFQAFNLLPRTTALKNVSLPMMYAGIPKTERQKKATHFLELVGLKDRLQNTSSQLSGGQQQRVAIARALTMSPSILLADEPTGNLPTNQSFEIMSIFQQLNEEGHTVIMITHEPDIAAHAKRVITLRDGKIIKDQLNKKRAVRKHSK